MGRVVLEQLGMGRAVLEQLGCGAQTRAQVLV